jgi:signal peptidase II
MKRKPSLLRYALFVIALVDVAIDQYTKAWVRNNLVLHESWDPIPWLSRIVTFTYARNTGAAFGLFPSMSIIFVFAALIVVLAIIIYYRRLAETSWFLQVTFGLQMGGAIGNLIDRLTRGYVTDFINFRIWPVFNVADASIVVGTALLAYFAIFLDQSEEEAAAEKDADTSVGGEMCSTVEKSHDPAS